MSQNKLQSEGKVSLSVSKVSQIQLQPQDIFTDKQNPYDEVFFGKYLALIMGKSKLKGISYFIFSAFITVKMLVVFKRKTFCGSLSFHCILKQSIFLLLFSCLNGEKNTV